MTEISLTPGQHVIEIAGESQIEHTVTFEDYISSFVPQTESEAEIFVKTIVI